MGTSKTFPVPTWVRTVVCLAPFLMVSAFSVVWLLTGRGLFLLTGASALCAAVVRHVLKKC